MLKYEEIKEGMLIKAYGFFLNLKLLSFDRDNVLLEAKDGSIKKINTYLFLTYASI